MEDFPSNSRSKRDDSPDQPKVKKLERVTQGEVLRRKRPIGKRIAETFVGGDAKSVWGFVMLDVLVPAAKDTIADAFSLGVERMLFGEARSSSRRHGLRPSGNNGFVSYNRYSASSTLRPPRDEPRNLSRRSRSIHNFDDIILGTRIEAEEVIDQLFELISKYQVATVAELYELVGIEGNYTDQKWGWSDIRGAGVTRIRNGYLLDLPKPEPLD